MKRNLPLTSICTLFVAGSSLSAAWELVDDFETGIDGWFLNNQPNAIAETIVDPLDASNTVLKLDSNDYGVGWGITFLSRDLPQEQQIPEGGTGTTYFRAYLLGTGSIYGYGLTDNPLVIDSETGFTSTPSNWTDMEPQISVNANGDFTLRSANVFASTTELSTLTVGQWYEFWAVVNNATGTLDDDAKWYYRTEGMTDPMLLHVEEKDTNGNVTNTYETALFRNGTTGPLTGVMIATISGDPAAPVIGDLAYFDDVYITVGAEDLSTPGGSAETWGGHEVISQGDSKWVDTGDFAGMLYINYAPWVWSNDFEKWVYMLEPADISSGAWTYIPRE